MVSKLTTNLQKFKWFRASIRPEIYTNRIVLKVQKRSQLIFDKGAKFVQWGKNGRSTDGSETTRLSFAKEVS